MLRGRKSNICNPCEKKG